MTAKEARDKAERFNSIKNDIVYKKLQEAIQDESSNGKYYVIVTLPDYIVENGNNGISYYIPIKKRLDNAISALKNDGFKVTNRPSFLNEAEYEITIDWSKEEDKT